MVETSLPGHVVTLRRDGRKQVLLHRSMALIGPGKVEIRSATGTVILPLAGLALAAGAGTLMAVNGPALPFWALVAMLLFCLAVVPISVMSLIGSLVGAEVVVDAKKGSAMWQQGYLGMGIGTKELVPFDRIDHLAVTVEGDQPDRWHEQSDDVRQFGLELVKKSGKRLTLAQVPVPAYGQADGMDRILAAGHAIGALVNVEVRLPEGWELVEIDTETGEQVCPANGDDTPGPAGGARGRRR